MTEAVHDYEIKVGGEINNTAVGNKFISCQVTVKLWGKYCSIVHYKTIFLVAVIKKLFIGFISRTTYELSELHKPI